jgi:hypothetical protein
MKKLIPTGPIYAKVDKTIEILRQFPFIKRTQNVTVPKCM